jgi:hypothetical protein
MTDPPLWRSIAHGCLLVALILSAGLLSFGVLVWAAQRCTMEAR